MTAKTGFTIQRAEPHERFITALVFVLDARGYGPATPLEVDGHRPDIKLPSGDLVEAKTGGPNLAIELDSLRACRRIELFQSVNVWIVHGSYDEPTERWTVDTPDSLAKRIDHGPRRRSGTGSNDDWYLVKGRGALFDEFFPIKVPTVDECCGDAEWHCSGCGRHLARLYLACENCGVIA